MKSNPIFLPDLAAGERNAGLVFDAEGTPKYWLVLLAGKLKPSAWMKARQAAIEAGGELPTRQEQALLYAHCKDAFEPDWYWSAEQPSDASYAWCQHFLNGVQYTTDVSAELPARAVRRVPI
jgi:hypothetical protein